MNLKKILQKRAEKDAEALLSEEDELFIQQLARAYDEKKDAKKKGGKQKSKNDKDK